MRDGNDLARIREPKKTPPDGVSDPPGGSGIRFIEDQGGRASFPRPGRLQGEEETRGFPARRDFADRRRRHLATRAEEKLDAVQTVLGEVPRAAILSRLGARRQRFHSDPETGPRDPEANQFLLHPVSESCGSGFPGGAERSRESPIAGGARLRGAYRPTPFLSLIGEAGKRIPNLGGSLEERVGAAPSGGVAAFEPPQHDEPVFDFRKPRGRRAHPVASLPDGGSQIFHFHEQVRTSLPEAVALRVHRGRLVEGPERDRQLGACGHIRPVEHLIRMVEPAGEVFGMAERLPLGQQGLDLAALRARPFDLFERPFEVVAPHGSGAESLGETIALLLGGPQRAEGDGDLSAELGMTTRRVHGFPRRPGEEQREVLPLAVDLGKTRSRRAKRRHGGRRAVHCDSIGNRAPSRREAQLSPNHEFAVIERKSGFLTRRPQPFPTRRSLVRRGEGRLHHRAVRDRPHELRPAPAAENESEGLEQHTLAHPGLAGDHVQSFLEFERNVLEQSDVPRPQPMKHRGSEGTLRRTRADARPGSGGKRTPPRGGAEIRPEPQRVVVEHGFGYYMLGIRALRPFYVFARFTASCSALLGAGVSFVWPRSGWAGQAPAGRQAPGEPPAEPVDQALDEAVTAVELDSSAGFFGEGGMLGLVVEAGPVSWFVLAILLFFSLVSWAIILSKARQLGQAERASAAFLTHFRSAKRFADVVTRAQKGPTSPLARLFNAGYQEVRYQSRRDDEESMRLQVSNMEAVARSLLRASSTEAATLEQRMIFLATTGGATPFIGLFGTVWGIMNAFQDIALTQAANISVVAPGVSEALIATAAGLAAAIPAVIAYNAFLARIRRITGVMDDFSMEYVAMLERHLAR